MDGPRPWYYSRVDISRRFMRPHRGRGRDGSSVFTIAFADATGGGAAAVLLLIAAPQVARADDQSAQTSTPQRPAIMFNRWQEDWSVLADSRVPRQRMLKETG